MSSFTSSMITLQNLSKLGKKVLVIGLSGVTCGGKSSIASLLKSHFPNATFVCQDNFYHSNLELLPKAPNGANYQPNWDSLDSLDMISMTRKVKYTMESLSRRADPKESIIIIDGFLIFNYLPLAEMCDLKFFIKLPFEECIARRQKRNYDPPDPPNYFVNVAWPMYLSNLEDLCKMYYASQIVYLDGTLTLQDNFQNIISDVQSYLNNM